MIAVFTGLLAAAAIFHGELTQTGYAGLGLPCRIRRHDTHLWFAGDKIVLATKVKEITTREQPLPLEHRRKFVHYRWPASTTDLCDSRSSHERICYRRDPKHGSVAVTTGLIEALENEELEGVMAHELSHIKNEDIKVMMLAAVLVGAITILGDSFLRGMFFSHRDRDENSGSRNGVCLIIGLAFLIRSPLIGQLIKLAISRRREYLADASGALLTRNPEGLARALEKISTQSSSCRSCEHCDRTPLDL